MVNLLWTF